MARSAALVLEPAAFGLVESGASRSDSVELAAADPVVDAGIDLRDPRFGFEVDRSADHPHEVESWPIGRAPDGEQIVMSECVLCGELLDLTA